MDMLDQAFGVVERIGVASAIAVWMIYYLTTTVKDLLGKIVDKLDTIGHGLNNWGAAKAQLEVVSQNAKKLREIEEKLDKLMATK